MIPRATYRLQFHPGFTLEDARAIVPYLADLGISHVYASPLAEARSGSMHGYDVTDPTRIRAAFGSEQALCDLSGDLRDAGMGLILDIVPNHMAAHPENPWWADVLRHGQASEYARFFDIDWSRHDGRVLLPVLGTPLDEAVAAGDVELVEADEQPLLRLYGEQDYPLAPGSVVQGDLRATLDKQRYRLAWWRLGHDELNWRRFFSISELAGLRIEDDAVFEAVHALPLRLYREGLIDGLRIDHVDGLADPAAYLDKLRARLDAERKEDRAWLLVEKILAPGEALPSAWPVDGTTGYDFMEEVSLLLHASQAEGALTRHWHMLSGRRADFEDEERRARRQLLHWEFSAQFEQCVEALVDLAACSHETARHSRAAWARAVEALLIVFPVYRTYGIGEHAPEEDERVQREAARRLPEVAPPGEAELGHSILKWLAGEGPAADRASNFVQRFQQLSAPIAAKAVEDTAFYRYGRWISRNDVGFDPAHFSVSSDMFHEWQRKRAVNAPRSMLSTATHDHKRGEDVRARLFAVSEVVDEWTSASDKWMTQLPGAGEIDRSDLYQLLQAVIGAWPDDPAALPDYADRLRGYSMKTLREAKLRSSWTDPNEGYEQDVAAVIERLVVGEDTAFVREDIEQFLSGIAPLERVKGLAQTFLRLTCPGVPDTYQGAELAERSLVDPDNRRPVDYDLRRRLLREGTDEKLGMIRTLLHLRAQYPRAFAGQYEPVEAGRNALAFIRQNGDERLLMVTALREIDGTLRDCVRDAVPEARNSLLGAALPCAVFRI